MVNDAARRSVLWVAIAVALLIGSWVATARAQSPPATEAPEAASAPPQPADDVAKKEAMTHFLRGLDFARNESNWEAALAEFLTSLELFPTQVATRNAALSLTHLGRYPEALEMYDNLQRNFGSSLQGEEKTAVEQAIQDLRERVGELDIRSSEDGATVLINEHVRGKTPLPKPVLVAPGTHLVRVTKEGFDPFEQRVLVASRQRKAISANLRRSAERGPPPVAQPPPAPPPAETAPPRRFYVAGFGGPAFARTLGTDTLATSRDRPFGVWAGARFGYELLPRLGLDFTLAYLGLGERLERTVVATGDENRRYTATDYEDRTSVMSGAAAVGLGYRFLHRTPIETRLAFGLARARVSTENSGTYAIAVPNPPTGEVFRGTQRVSIPELAENQWLPLIAPEIRIGYRVSDRLSVDLGVALLVLFGPSDLRTGRTSLSRSGERRAALDNFPGRFMDGELIRPGLITLPAERSIGTFAVLAPSAGVRLEL
jgi:hypothetical protein